MYIYIYIYINIYKCIHVLYRPTYVHMCVCSRAHARVRARYIRIQIRFANIY